MAKVTLAKEPTFSANVKIPVPGQGLVSMQWTFKWRSKTELKAFFESIADESEDVKVIMKIAEGWELDDEFNADNINLLIEKYQMTPRALYDAYINEMTRAREGN